MEGAEIIVLPVVRIDRGADGLTLSDLANIPASVTDINAFRYRRERALVERRASQSLLPELGSP